MRYVYYDVFVVATEKKMGCFSSSPTPIFSRVTSFLVAWLAPITHPCNVFLDRPPRVRACVLV